MKVVPQPSQILETLPGEERIGEAIVTDRRVFLCPECRGGGKDKKCWSARGLRVHRKRIHGLPNQGKFFDGGEK